MLVVLYVLLQAEAFGLMERLSKGRAEYLGLKISALILNLINTDSLISDECGRGRTGIKIILKLRGNRVTQFEGY